MSSCTEFPQILNKIVHNETTIESSQYTSGVMDLESVTITPVTIKLGRRSGDSTTARGITQKQWPRYPTWVLLGTLRVIDWPGPNFDHLAA